jgi:hypothetical protein
MDGGNKLSLSRAGCTDALKLGLVRNSAASKTEDVAGDGATGARISGMGGIHKTNKRVQGVERKVAEVVSKSIGRVEGNSGEEGAWARAPVDDTPIASATKVFADELQGQVVFLGGGRGEAREEGGRVSNVGAADDVGISKLAEDLTKGVADLFLEGTMSGSTLGRARREFNKALGEIHRKGNDVMAVSFLVARRFPTVSLQDAVNVSLTIELYVVASLVDIDAVVLDAETAGASFTHAKTLGGDAIVDERNQGRSGGRVEGGHSKVVDLTADKNIFAIDEATIEIAFVGGVAELEFVDQDTGDHALPKATSFRVALEGTEDGNDVCATIQGLVEALEVP